MPTPKPCRARAARVSVRRRRLFAEALEGRRLLANVPMLVGDVNQTSDQLGVGQSVQVGSVAFFAGRSTAADGDELFRTDGTRAGTTLVKDINPSIGSDPQLLTKVGTTLYFTADDGVSGRELWRSDGTAAGTTRVADLNAGAASSNPTLLTEAGGSLYFVTTDAVHGVAALWRTVDAAGAPEQITNSGTGAPVVGVSQIARFGTKLVFAAGGQLYRIDVAGDGGTATAIAGAPTSALNLTSFGGAVYFTLASSATGNGRGDLWRTDGTAAGTTLVRTIDFLDPSGFGDYATVSQPVASGDRLYFIAGSATSGKYDLWTSDGTTAGTAPLTTSGTLGRTASLMPFGARSVLFQNASAAAGTEPWASDGSVAGTRLLVDSVPGTATPDGTAAVAIAGGRALFTTVVSGNASKVWTTDGTPANTTLVTTISSAASIAYPVGALDGVALIAGIRSFDDGDLYRSDGTAAGTFRVGATTAGNGSSLSDFGVGRGPAFVAAGGNAVYFDATDGSTGLELWRSVNNAPPTRVADLVAGGADSSPNDFTVAADGSLYFTAGGSGQRNVYRVANATAAPQLVLASNAFGTAAAATTFSNLAAVGNTLYFRVDGGSLPSGRLYRFDPAVGQAAAVTLDGNYFASGTMLRVGDAWFFGATPTNSTGSYSPGQRLYRIGIGASAVPALVADIPSDVSYSSYLPDPLVSAGATLYFRAFTKDAGSELYRTDGTAAGTAMVADLTPGTASTSFADGLPGNALGTADGVAYFTAYTADSTSRVYRTDGTAAGTYAIGGADVSSVAASFVDSGGDVYFLASSASAAKPVNGVYRVNGNTATPVAPVTSGDAAFAPTALTLAGGRVFLIGSGGANARWELWQADASLGNFERVSILGPRTPNAIGGTLQYFFVAGRFAFGASSTDLYFPMYSDARGVEPYRLALGAPATTGSIAGAVYQDVNGNGVRDGYDAAASAVDVWIDRDGDGAFDASSEPRTTSAADGTYRFDGLAPGTYAVRILSAGYRRVQAGTASEIVVVAGGVTAAADLSVTTYIGVTPTTVDEGGKVSLTGRLAGEIPPNLVYTWDFNAVTPGAYTIDATGQTVTYDAATLDGTNDNSSYRLTILFVRDAAGTLVSSFTFPLLINNVAPTATLTAGNGVPLGNATTVRFGNVADPSAADVAAGFKYSFDFNNDGDFADAGDVLNSTSSSASFAFAKAGTYPVRGRIADKDGGFTDYTASAVVTAPTAPPAPTRVGFDNASFVEGASGTLFGFASPLAAGQSIATWEYDYDYDGVTFDVDATGQRPTFVAPDGPASRTIGIRVTDNFGQVVIAKQTVRITNADPTATFAATIVGNTATATFNNPTDPSVADRAAGLKYSFDFNGDGDFTDVGDVSNSASPTASFTFAAAGTHTIYGLIADKDGGLNFYTTSVRTAAPPPPSGLYFETSRLNEGGPQAFLVGHAATVAGQSIVKYEWDFNYVNNTFTPDVISSTTFTFPNTTWFDYSSYDGPAAPTVALRVTDDYGQTAVVAQAVPIANVAPTAALSSSASGLTATATFANATDPSAADRAAGFRYSFDFNNDGDFADVGDVANSTSPTASFAFKAGGTYSIRGRVADKDGGFTDYTTNVAINVTRPAAPTNVGFGGGPVAEGHAQTLTGLASVAAGQSILKWEYDFDYDGKTFDVNATGPTPKFDASNIDGPATRVIGVRVTDNFGQVAIGTQALAIVNVAPAATFAVVAGSVGGTAVATFTKAGDDGVADRAAGFRYSFDFNNDGDFTDAGEVDRGTSSTATGRYTIAGTYTVLGRIYDKDGDYTKYVAAVTVAAPPTTVYPPSPSFVGSSVAEGEGLTLGGFVSTTSGNAIVKWEYDFDYVNNVFTADATTQNPTFSAANLDGPTTRQVAIRVTDSAGLVGLRVQTIAVTNAPPVAEFVARADSNGTATLSLTGATDASAADRAAGFKFSFDFNGDGDYADAGEVANGTSPTASFKYAAAGTYRVRGRVTDKDGGVNEYATDLTLTVPPPTTTPTKPVQLTGTPIGTAGSIGGNTIAKAFDGSLATFVDLPGGGPYAVGLDLGSAKTIASVKFAPRAGLARRMTGGTFQASNSATFATGVVTLGTIAAQPAEGVLTTLTFAASTATYRYVRYVPPAGSFGNVAELQFFGAGGGTTPPPVVTPPVVTPPVVTPPTTGTPTKLTGAAIGTAGSIGGNTFAKALDGDLSTFVDSTTANGAWVGLDLGTAKVIKQIKFAPRATLGRRIVGGYFQGSNSADFGVAATLFTIASAPPDGVLTSVDLANPQAYRYVRYVAPASSFGNVAEVQFYG